MATTFGSRARLLQKSDYHVEGFIRVVQQHIFLADGREHVTVVVAYSFGNPGRKIWPQKIWARVEYQFF